MTTDRPPKRRLHLTLDLHADSKHDLDRALNEVLRTIDEADVDGEPLLTPTRT